MILFCGRDEQRRQEGGLHPLQLYLPASEEHRRHLQEIQEDCRLRTQQRTVCRIPPHPVPRMPDDPIQQDHGSPVRGGRAEG